MNATNELKRNKELLEMLKKINKDKPHYSYNPGANRNPSVYSQMRPKTNAEWRAEQRHHQRLEAIAYTLRAVAIIAFLTVVSITMFAIESLAG